MKSFKYTREKPFIERITRRRANQVVYVRKRYLIQMGLDWLFFSLSPFLMISSTLAVYVLLVGAESFTPEKAFVVVLVFNLLDFAVECLPTTVGDISQGSLASTSNKLSIADLEFDQY